MARHSQQYQSVHEALHRAGAAVGAAEAHGSLCGVLCCAGSGARELWLHDSLADLDGGNAQIPAARAALEHLEADTWATLNASAMEFTPLLPDDDVDIVVRIEALAHWCHGFLYGVTLSGASQAAKTSDLGAEHFDEVLKDLAEISRAGLAADDDEVQADFAYAEVVEFVRAGVQLLFEELIAFRAQPPASRQKLH